MSPLEPKKILVIRLSSIGDILLTTPLLRLTRRRFPQAEIHFAIKSEFAALLAHSPYTDQLHRLDKKEGWQGLLRLKNELYNEKFDLILDIHRNWRSWLLRDGRAKVVTYPKYYLNRLLLVRFGWNRFKQIVPVSQRYLYSLRDYGVQDDAQGPDFFLTDEEQQYGRQLLLQHDATAKWIGFAVGAGYETKQWPADYFSELAKKMTLTGGTRIILFGNEKEMPIAQSIAAHAGPAVVDCSGRLNLRQTAAIMSHLDLMITNDSGLMHLAAALKRKTLALFGSTTRELGFFPHQPFVTVMERPLSCRPCSHVGRHRCPKGHFRCMRELTPEMVFDRMKTL